MSSPTFEPAAPAPEVKEEDSIVADSAAEGTAPQTVEDGLTKKDFDLMTGILHRITNFRDEEYVPTLKYPIRLIRAN
jgi:chromatin structure-remodeling complex subunit RSC1/2